MGRLRRLGRADGSLDILARNDTAHSVEQVAGCDRRAVGKARLTSAGAGGEHAAQSKEAQFLFRFDTIPCA